MISRTMLTGLVFTVIGFGLFLWWPPVGARGQGAEAARASLALVPNPILVSTDGVAGYANLVWSAPGVAMVEIHIGSAAGPLIASGGSAGIAMAGSELSNGTEFYLVATGDGPAADRTLASVTATTRPYPEIWFHPHDDLPRSWLNFTGSIDYWDLFQVNAPWSTAAAGVRVFGISWSLAAQASDAQLRALIGDLNRRQILIAMEVEALVVETGCGGGGYSAAGQVATWLRRLKSLGAEVATSPWTNLSSTQRLTSRTPAAGRSRK